MKQGKELFIGLSTKNTKHQLEVSWDNLRMATSLLQLERHQYLIDIIEDATYRECLEKEELARYVLMRAFTHSRTILLGQSVMTTSDIRSSRQTHTGGLYVSVRFRSAVSLVYQTATSVVAIGRKQNKI